VDTLLIPYTVYIVDDEPLIRDSISLALRKRYDVKTFPQAEPAIEAMAAKPPDLFLMDVGLPGISGLEALTRIRRSHPDLLVIMITAYEDVRSVVSAMRQGAYDYVVKPLHMESLLKTIENALDSIRMRKEIQALHARVLNENFPCFIGESNAIQGVMHLVEKVAKSPDTPVLILGETGTGKELIAGAIHYQGPRFNGPLVTVNCAAIPKDLIESELFGYEKGAFSGADASGKVGLVEQSAEGTLFLDEVGDLSVEAQAKLLRFLEEGEFYRVGGTKKRQIKTKVISATNLDIDEMVESGRFRRDLYYRLAVVTIQIPSLNDRPEDILPLSKHFVVEFSKKFGKTFSSVSVEAQQALKEHRWKGNIRELRNLIEHAVLIGDGPELTLRDLTLTKAPCLLEAQSHGSGIQVPALTEAGVDFPGMLEDVERYYLQESLRLARGNESRAATLLNLSRDTLRYRRRKLGIS
jgi:DNA-binding NtrC family response regulator